MKSSESRTAIWAALPIKELAVEGSAWWTSNLTSVTFGELMIGWRRLETISLYAAPIYRDYK